MFCRTYFAESSKSNFFLKIISFKSNLFLKIPLAFFLFKRCDDRDSVMATSIKLSWPTQNTFPTPLYHIP